MVFNVVARNRDDHVKEHRLPHGSRWRGLFLPAFLTWAWPTGRWTSARQMSINGKRDGFEPGDFFEVGETGLR